MRRLWVVLLPFCHGFIAPRAPSTCLSAMSASPPHQDGLPAPRAGASPAAALRSWAAATALAVGVLSAGGPLGAPPPRAFAAELTEDQRVLAETWRIVDKLFVDRTFNGLDWFAARQDVLKKRYASPDDAYAAAGKLVGRLGDEYTRYLPPAQYNGLVAATTSDRSVAGVGVTLENDKRAGGAVTIVAVQQGAPAEAAGLRAGDVLLAVDGASLTTGEGGAPLTADDAAGMLRGVPGTGVAIKFARDGDAPDAAPREAKATRAQIQIKGVSGVLAPLRGESLGVVRIAQFTQSTADEVAAELKALRAQGAQAFAIDLRRNAGGFLGGGIDTARLLLPRGATITTVVDKTGAELKYDAVEDGPEAATPLYVVVDEKTASASEVLTAALLDNGRATVVGGPRTFGKGIIQTIEPIREGRAGGVAVTVARYRTPAGNYINKVGVTADRPTDCPSSLEAVKCIEKTL